MYNEERTTASSLLVVFGEQNTKQQTPDDTLKTSMGVVDPSGRNDEGKEKAKTPTRILILLLIVVTPLLVYDFSADIFFYSIQSKLGKPHTLFLETQKNATIPAYNGNNPKDIVERTIILPRESDLVGAQNANHSIVLRDGEISPLQNCPPTTQVRIIIPKSKKDNWILESLDSKSRPKTIGGDEFYITYTDYSNPNMDKEKTNDPTGVALIKDLENGKYLLDFIMPPMMTQNGHPTYSGAGKLIVFFQYTCGMGQYLRPTKNHWHNNGSVRRSHAYWDIPLPPIRSFEFPRRSITLTNYQKVICFGDSTMGNFCGKFWNKVAFTEPNIITKGKIGSELSMDALGEYWKKLQKQHSANLAFSAGNKTALILGSAVWDILEPIDEQRRDPNFHNHLTACRLLIKKVKTKYPHVDVLWKSPTAFHVQSLDTECYTNNQKCVTRTRYMSSSLAKDLYERQKSLVEGQLGIPFLDLYDATYLSASWLMEKDGRHYRTWLNKLLLGHYYETAS